ncbi:Hypothetical protein PHPALM_18484 [Phytophthora palmivora]|uniref:Uncharacterized protein n=1 Tax=Phytophthora palmivora TaxID=4796 RepID=A0A2P4XJM1_9STRA|nr:Hypothetical protein PHPALM_18484 [Phytophthora palmivora]
MRRQRITTGFLQMAATTDGKYSDVLNVVYDASLMKLLRDYTRRKGYIEIQQDDRGMYSNVLMGTSDSWENVRVTDVKTDDAAI